MDILVQIVLLLIQVLIFAIFARAILSWFPIDRDGPVYRALDFVAEPILEPLRRVIPMVGMVDITPMVAILLLYVISSVLQQY
ncbi:MAG: YggT family protein [Dehalococcoidia bacterium]|nr:YggT family protein [Dehalococcoidia bacterium]